MKRLQSTSILLSLAAPVCAQEMPEDVRGEWVADVNPTTRAMFLAFIAVRVKRQD